MQHGESIDYDFLHCPLTLGHANQGEGLTGSRATCIGGCSSNTMNTRVGCLGMDAT